MHQSSHSPATAIQQQSSEPNKPLSQACQTLLKKILLTIAKGEKSVERQRQILASVSDFEPHVAFQRIDRDNDSQVTPIEILTFLRDNGVEDATEADCHFLVNYYANSGDNAQRKHKVLDFDDMLQLLMPVDNPILRTTLAQRPIFAVASDGFLSKEIEIELTRLFEKEIAFNRVTEELKQRLVASKDFNFWRAFLSIDDWNYGFIDRKNLASFLRKLGSKASSCDCLAIIRRLDLDCDARLSFQEFVEGLSPDTPFSKNLKREEMKREEQRKEVHDHVMDRGKMLILGDQERQDIRRMALDRELHQQRNNSAERTGLHQASPLKMRPVIVRDLSMFGTPRVSRSKSATNKRFKRKRHRMHSISAMQLGKFAGGGPIHPRPRVKSQSQKRKINPRHTSKSKSKSKSARANKSIDSMGMSSKSSFKGRSKSARKRSALRRKVVDTNKQVPLSRSRSSQRVSRSRSRRARPVPVGAGSDSGDHTRKIQEKYRSFIIKKFGRDWAGYEQDLDNQGRHAQAPLRPQLSPISVNSHSDNEVMRRSPRRERSQSLRFKETTPRNTMGSLRKKVKRQNSHNFNKHDQGNSRISMPSAQTQNASYHDYRNFYEARDSTNTLKKGMSPFNRRLPKKKPIFESLNSKKQRASKPVITSGTPSAKRVGLNSSFRVKSSLKTSETPQSKKKFKFKNGPQLAFLLQCLHEIMKLEKDCEIQKINLSLKQDFNLIDAFGMLDQQAQGSVSPTELLIAMNGLGLTAFTLDDAQLIFARFNKDGDGKLKYSDFADAFMPINQHYARLLGSKRLQCSVNAMIPPPQNENNQLNNRSPLRYQGGRNLDLNLTHHQMSTVPLFTKETHQAYMQTWDLMAITERAIESIRKRLSRKSDFDIEKAFNNLDPGKPKNGFITILTISDIFQQFGLVESGTACQEDIQLLVNRLDSDKDGKISLMEFVRGLTPRSTSQACYSAAHPPHQFKAPEPQFYVPEQYQVVM